MIYLDYAATTPMREEAIEAYSYVAKNVYGNASSLHDVGTSANDILTKCRVELASQLNGNKDGIYFTGSGSEANHLAIRSLLKGNSEKGTHLITTNIEHSSIHLLFSQLEKEGYEVTYLEVNEKGQINIEDVKKAVKRNTCLVSIQHANSEIGTIQPLKEIGNYLKEANILFHSDCVQSFGKIKLDVTEFNLDSISISAHKIYGPKGVGAVYINPKVNWAPIVEGTTHEGGMRAGTVDIPSIVAFITASQLMHTESVSEMERLLALKTFFLQELNKRIPIAQLEGDIHHSLPNITSIRFKGIEGQYIMLECNRAQIAISTGSACQIGQQAPSRTMLALGRTEEEARELVRFSFGKYTTVEDLYTVIHLLESITNNWSERYEL